jgi:hypothetical protein
MSATRKEAIQPLLGGASTTLHTASVTESSDNLSADHPADDGKCDDEHCLDDDQLAVGRGDELLRVVQSRVGISHTAECHEGDGGEGEGRESLHSACERDVATDRVHPECDHPADPQDRGHDMRDT